MQHKIKPQAQLLLARLVGQYCFARWRLLSVIVYNSAAAAGRVGGRTADTAQRASMVTSL